MNTVLSLILSHLPYYLFSVIMVYESIKFRKKIEKLVAAVNPND